MQGEENLHTRNLLGVHFCGACFAWFGMGGVRQVYSGVKSARTPSLLRSNFCVEYFSCITPALVCDNNTCHVTGRKRGGRGVLAA